MQYGEYRDLFHIPQINGKDTIYLCGNSLGLQPKKAREYVNAELDDWAALGVEGHLHARHPWLPYHEFLTLPMAKLVGGLPSEVVVMNSLTVNLHLLMASFYRPTKHKYKIIVESDAFPSDRYAIASQAAWHGFDEKDSIIEWKPEAGSFTPSLSTLEEILHIEGDSIALILIGGVNYYTGQLHNIKAITTMAHQHGIIAGFDLAHAAGNVELFLHDWDVDFAAWCSYKYLNSGPGSLGAIFIHDKHGQDLSVPRLSGWWGHNKETRFRMRDAFDPLRGAEGWQLSNPPILPMAAMRASMEIFDVVGMQTLRTAAKNTMSNVYDQLNAIDGIRIITPENIEERGCQLSLLIENNGRETFEYLSSEGVVADWREPNVIRIAPVPLYNTQSDIDRFVDILRSLLPK